MNNYKIFIEYKDKIFDIKEINDAISLIEQAKTKTSNPTELKLLVSLLNKNRYQITMDLEKFKLYIDIIDIIYYQNDAQRIFDDIKDIITDSAQINTLLRIIKKKPFRKIQTLELDLMQNQNYQMKTCPHCRLKNTAIEGTSYIICGYTSRGFDWKGCGRDWCFKCGYKLCKNWNIDMLFNRLNRYHDSKCCKIYSLKLNDDIYPDNYCFCFNENVNRNR
jgi:hypothetical protein